MNKTEFTREMLDCFHRLPKEALPACIWACKNSEQVFSMIETEPYSTEKIDKLIQDSLERKDYVLLLLAVFKKQHDEKLSQATSSRENPAPSL